MRKRVNMTCSLETLRLLPLASSSSNLFHVCVWVLELTSARTEVNIIETWYANYQHCINPAPFGLLVCCYLCNLSLADLRVPAC